MRHEPALDRADRRQRRVPGNFGRAVEAGQPSSSRPRSSSWRPTRTTPSTSTGATGGTTTLVSTGPDGRQRRLWTRSRRGRPRDGTHVFFTTREALVARRHRLVAGRLRALRRHDDARLHRPSGGNGDAGADFAGISDDGKKVFFETPESLVAADTDTAQDVYERSGGTTTLVSTGPTGATATRDALFDGSSQDGSRVFFSTYESLVAADTDGGRTSMSARAARPRSTRSGPRAATAACAQASWASSDTGSRVFIETPERLNTADRQGQLNDVYESSGGTVTLLTPGGNDTAARRTPTSSAHPADGSKVFIRTEESLAARTPTTTRTSSSARRASLTLLRPAPRAATGRRTPSSPALRRRHPRLLRDRPRRWSRADTDTNTDVYERYGGTTNLLSTGPSGGNGAYDATFRAASTDGQRVFFRTAEALLSADTD